MTGFYSQGFKITLAHWPDTWRFPRLLDLGQREAVADQAVQQRPAFRDHLHDLGRVGQIVVPRAEEGQPLADHVRADAQRRLGHGLAHEGDFAAPSCGVDAEPVRRDHARTVDGVVHALAAGQVPDLIASASASEDR